MTDRIEELVRQAQGIVVPYSDEYEEAHTLFAQKMWPQKRRRRVPEYIRWKFRGPAHGPVEGFLLAVADGRVVGQLGVIPVTLQVNDRTYPAQWACDLMVDSGLRRMRYGSLLLAAAIARPLVSLGSDPSPSADAAMSRLGFRSIAGPRQMILPLQPGQAVRERLPQRMHFLAPLLALLARPFIRLRMLRLHRQNTASSCRVGSWREAQCSIHEQSIASPHILHDASFLEWRCEGLAGFSPALEAVSVEPGAFAVFQGTALQLLVYEWQAKNFHETRSLVQQIVRLGMEHNSQTVVVYANSAEERSWLGKLGFLARRTPAKIIYYPDQPLCEESYFHYCLYDSDGNL